MMKKTRGLKSRWTVPLRFSDRYKGRNKRWKEKYNKTKGKDRTININDDRW